jgi:hypothetical protein
VDRSQANRPILVAGVQYVMVAAKAPYVMVAAKAP